MMLAELLHDPDFEISEDQATRLGAAIERVQAFYSKAILPPVWAAWIGLGQTAAGIYIPKVRRKLRRAPPKESGGGAITQ